MPRRSYRQTLINFQPVPSRKLSQDTHHTSPKRNKSTLPPRPPPSLPNEVWGNILRPLGTIALKKFRLVCSEWSVIGSAWLFQTIYLNRFEKSWSGLVSLSTSKHATRVHCVEWNPLVLYDDCNDAAVFALRYEGLLCGLSHRDTVRYFDAYQQVYRTHRTVLRSTTLTAAIEALHHLVNCRRAVVSDDFDLAGCCDDPLRSGIVKIPDILHKPSVWGLRHPCHFENRRLKFTPESERLETAVDIFDVLAASANVTSMTLVVWENRLQQLVQPAYWQRSNGHARYRALPLDNGHLITLNCKLKSPDRTFSPSWDRWTCFPPDREITLNHFRNFSSLKSFQLELTLTDPRAVRSATRHEWEDDSSASDQESNASSTDSASSDVLNEGNPHNDSFVVDRPDGFTQSMFECLCVPLELSFLQFASLTSLTLSNVSLSAKSLLCFLCCQQQLPQSSFSLEFEDTIILYDFDPEVFFICLRQLNVAISYNAANTYYYPPDSAGYHTEWHLIPNVYCSANRQSRRVLSPEAWESCPNRPHLRQDDIPIPKQLPPSPRLARQTHAANTLMIFDRPYRFRYSTPHLTSIPLNKLFETQIYRLRKEGGHTIWEWVPGSSAIDPNTRLPWKNIYPALSVRGTSSA